MNRALLDTHSFLWFVDDDRRSGKLARATIEDASVQILFSPASVWELSIKVSLGKLDLRPEPVGFFETQAEKNDFTLLPIELRHLAPIASLPFHHRHPFDRLLIAQALVEGVPIISRDAAFDAYEGLVRIG